MFADKFLPQSRATRRIWGAAFLLSLMLLFIPWIFRLNGKPHDDWQQFLGRFHPLAVHLPIALILLVPLFEIAGVFKPSLREAAGFVLGLASATCIGSLLLGYLLAYGGGSAGPGVSRHMWAGILLTICALVSMLARPYWSIGAVTKIYPALLALTLVVMMWTAHQGGSLTHGSNYLTKYMPGPFKSFISLGNSRSAPSSSFYSQHIHPIWDKNCLSCHGDGKIEGELRIDTYDALMKGGKDGPVIMPNKPDESLLLKRVTLPEGHKLFMPSEGKPPLSAEEIVLIKAWIQQGASPTIPHLQGISFREETKEIPIDPVADYSALQSEIDRMKSMPGAKLINVSAKSSDGLVLNTLDVAGDFGDTQLAQFEKFAPYIVEVNLARTTITDASFTTLAKFKNLRAVHLEGTGVSGSGIASLTGLKKLSYLNLSDTKVTSFAASQLSSLKSLQHIYLFNTPAQPLANKTTAKETP